jgi:hypothetical protein
MSSRQDCGGAYDIFSGNVTNGNERVTLDYFKLARRG